ncbi:hypothetical protein [Thalassobius sp. Cn5-15]|uniref:hypothetical protein n=1 Tax=Thalassobius sp. Cn5-15 TaxID=2917763 RepID=UPI001EF29884|nr:hypothetical protein [Thalassobius sp. Cn5-15]MCG7493610.1 hypothetical protein [Thalassobius sp. Cn5-15]
MACVLIATLLAGCASTYPPSVPSQPGKSYFAAREAVRQCIPEARVSGSNAVTVNYVLGVLLGGVLLGPMIIAENEDQIRYAGEARGTDRCLEDADYSRRELTAEEVQILQQSYGEYRIFVLDQLVAGEAIQR